jgi:uncharacterized protein YbaR (Trm112 family)
MLFEESYKSIFDNTSRKFTCKAGKRNWPIITGISSRFQVILLLYTVTAYASFQISGMSPVCKQRLKIIDNGRAMQPAAALQKIAGILLRTYALLMRAFSVHARLDPHCNLAV